MQVDQSLDDGKPEAGALLGSFDRVASLAERRQHYGDFFLRNAGAGIAHADVLPARGGPADLDPDLAALRRELDRVGKKIEAYLADRALVGPDFRQIRFVVIVDRDATAGGADLEKMMALLGDMHDVD